MKATLRTFSCGDGDCIFLKLADINTGESFHIMIDCGALSDEIVDYVSTEFNCRIDVLIVTHIDCDHIDGITALLYEPGMENIHIEHIIYNCLQIKPNEIPLALPETENKVIRGRINTFTQTIKHIAETDISVSTAISLAATILQKDNLKNAWGKERITKDSNITVLGDKWGKLIWLSPTSEALDNLYSLYRNAYAGITGKPAPTNVFTNQEEIYEQMLLMENARKKPYRGRRIAYGLLDQESFATAADNEYDENSVSLANKASLAFVWEYENKRILFMGDAMCSVVCDSLKSQYHTDNITFELIKISHHGSKYSTSKELVSMTDTDHFFLTGGKKEERPTLDALSKILSKPVADNRSRTLHYNVETPILLQLSSKECSAIRDRYKFALTKNSIYEFEY